jgi:hypothetical protein
MELMTSKRRLWGQRGAVIIHVAFAILALLLFTGAVIDGGVMYVARRQAQNAADAGALAGARSLMIDPAATELAENTAKHFAGLNQIWGQNTAPADVIVSTPLPWPCPPQEGGGNGCIRVDVMRGMPDHAGAGHGNTLPVYFLSMAGIGSQGVRATATAQVAAGNAVRCLKPWIVADKWIDNSGAGLNPSGWDQGDTYDAPPDTYTAPGFRAAGPNNDYGVQLVLKQGTGNANAPWGAGWTMEIDFGRTGSNVYRDEIAGCPDYVPTVGLYDGVTPCSSNRDDANPPHGCISVKSGMSQGPTQGGVHDLVNLDPSAYWDTGNNDVAGGCMASGTCQNPTGLTNLSPRIVPIAIFNTQAFWAESSANDCQTQNCVAQVINLLGFFLEGMCDEVYPNQATRPSYCGDDNEARKAVVGRLMHYPGQFLGGAGPANEAAFVQATRLIR